MFLITNFYEHLEEPIVLLDNCIFRNPNNDKEIEFVLSFVKHAYSYWTFDNKDIHHPFYLNLYDQTDIKGIDIKSKTKNDLLKKIAEKWVIFEYNQQMLDLFCSSFKSIEISFDDEGNEITEELIETEIERVFVDKLNSVFALIGLSNGFINSKSTIYNFFHSKILFKDTLSSSNGYWLTTNHHFFSVLYHTKELYITKLDSIVHNFRDIFISIINDHSNFDSVLFKSGLVYNYFAISNFDMKIMNLMILIEGVLTSSPDDTKYHIENTITKQFSYKVALLLELYDQLNKTPYTYFLKDKHPLVINSIKLTEKEKSNISDELKKIYSLRSSIVHCNTKSINKILKDLEKLYRDNGVFNSSDLSFDEYSHPFVYLFKSSKKADFISIEDAYDNPDLKTENLKDFLLRRIFSFASIVCWFDLNKKSIVNILSEKKEP